MPAWTTRATGSSVWAWVGRLALHVLEDGPEANCGPRPTVLPEAPQGPPIPTGKEVMILFIELVMFILSAVGLVAAGKAFLRRGHNFGLWGA
jgi:hypothetical protein